MDDLNKTSSTIIIEKEQIETPKHDIETPEIFQKFMLNLFEKNGIINNLRAYLRGHIVDVLKSSQTGDALECHKHFTSRLELTNQAVNMLISEYLLRLEFNYSLSVFVSEIPLANMVFGFAKDLINHGSDDYSTLRFRESDVWSIINYLGIKCDSEYATKIMNMYSSRADIPLLMCILKCNTKYLEGGGVDKDHSSKASVSSLNLDSDEECDDCNRDAESQCKHYVKCKDCQNKIRKIKEKFRRKKESFVEMFQQLKEVYETEVEMVREDEKKRARRFLDDHVQKLHERYDQLEHAYRNRAVNLETNIRKKKQFLWGLARSLREQHARVAGAMTSLKQETDKLKHKEETLKTKIAEAEELLKKRGEEMRLQISNELSILSKHLDTMRTERDAINKEKDELNRLKHDHSNTDLQSRYTNLKDEISILKRYIESNKKCMVENSTITDFSDVNLNVLLNNGSDVTIKSSKVVNDLKKQKNVNFSQSTVNDLSREQSRDRTGSSSSTDINEMKFSKELILRLQEENERLRTFSDQQRNHIDELSTERARLQAQLVSQRARDTYRPHTAPLTRNDNVYRSSTPITPTQHHKGSGEELSWFTSSPTVLRTGDTLPFIGVVADRTHDHKRYSNSHWSRLCRRVSPVRFTRSPIVTEDYEEKQGCSTRPDTSIKLQEHEERTISTTRNDQFDVKMTSPKQEISETKEKTPKTVLREVRRILKSNDLKISPQKSLRESPSGVLREAKLRLRKLEIEAEAVHNSYLTYRRDRTEGGHRIYTEDMNETGLDIKISKSLQQLSSHDKLITQRKDIEESIKKDIEKYLKNKDLGQTYFKNKTTTSRITTPIPKAYSSKDDKSNNYLETPLKEFRKYYQYDKHITQTTKTNQDAKNDLEIASVSNKNEVTKCEETVSKKNEITLQQSDNFKINQVEQVNTVDKENNEIIKKIDEKKSNHNLEDSDVKQVFDTDNSEILKEFNNELLDSTNEANNLAEVLSEKVVNDSEPTVNIEKKMNAGFIEVLDNINTIGNNDTKSSIGNEKTVESENIDKNSVNATNIEIVEDKKVNENTDLAVLENVSDTKDDNILKVEIENDINNSNTEMLLLVSPHSEIDNNGNISPRMTILVSPKRSSPTNNNANKDTDTHKILDSIFTAKNEESSVDLRIELAKENDSLSEKLSEKEYADDFSADVDNYNSRSDFEDNSPISLPKSYEEDNFWGS